MSRLVAVLSQAYSNIQFYHIVHILLIHTLLYKVGLTSNINNMSLFYKGGMLQMVHWVLPKIFYGHS